VFLIAIRVPDHIEKPELKAILPKLHLHLDPVGCVLLAAASIQLLVALQYGGNEYPWNSATIIGLFCGSGATALVWGYWNYRMGDAAMLPVSIITKRVVWSSALTQMLSFANTFVQSFFLPIYFQAVKGANPLMSGVYMLPAILSQILAGVTSGILSKWPPFHQHHMGRTFADIWPLFYLGNWVTTYHGCLLPPLLPPSALDCSAVSSQTPQQQCGLGCRLFQDLVEV
jgi:hypothetical protein